MAKYPPPLGSNHRHIMKHPYYRLCHGRPYVRRPIWSKDPITSVDPQKDGHSYLCRSFTYNHDPEVKRTKSFHRLKPNQAYRSGDDEYYGECVIYTHPKQVMPTWQDAWNLDPEKVSTMSTGKYLRYSIHTPSGVRELKHPFAFITDDKINVKYAEDDPVAESLFKVPEIPSLPVLCKPENFRHPLPAKPQTSLRQPSGPKRPPVPGGGSESLSGL